MRARPDPERDTIAVPIYRQTLPPGPPDLAGTLDEEELGLAFDLEDDRLPWDTAFPLILLLSLGAWALVATVALWLIDVMG